MKWTATLAVAVATVCLVSVQAYDPCPEGFTNFGEVSSSPICMSFAFENSTWHGTRTYCKSLNADLAKLTGDLHQKVISFIRNQPELKGEAFWIGGTDEEFEGRWVWITNDQKIPRGTPHWYPCNGTEPDGGSKQNYLSLLPPDWYFHSLDGNTLSSGICQI